MTRRSLTTTGLLRTTVLLLGLSLCGCGGSANDATDDGSTLGGPAGPVQADWFRHFENPGFAFAFGDTVKNYFYQRGLTSVLEEDGRLKVPGQEALIELDALARECARLPMQSWNDAIAAHFGELDALVRLLETRSTPAWEDARDDLRVRLHTDAFLAAAGIDAASVVSRRDLPGLMTCVVLDDEKTALMVPRGDLDVWNRPVGAVFEIALQNTRSELDGVVEEASETMPGIGTLHVVTGDSFYTSAAALWLDAWPDLFGDRGAFVVVPWQRAIFAFPFDDADDLRAVRGLYEFAEKIVAEQTDALSPDVYWRRPDGTFERIDIARDAEGNLRATPPAELLPLLKDG